MFKIEKYKEENKPEKKMVFSYPAQKTPAVYICSMHYPVGFPGGSVGKESACNSGDLG